MKECETEAAAEATAAWNLSKAESLRVKKARDLLLLAACVPPLQVSFLSSFVAMIHIYTHFYYSMYLGKVGANQVISAKQKEEGSEVLYF